MSRPWEDTLRPFYDPGYKYLSFEEVEITETIVEAVREAILCLSASDGGDDSEGFADNKTQNPKKLIEIKIIRFHFNKIDKRTYSFII